MWKKICLVLCMTIFLTGCVKVETDLTINKDGSAVVKERIMLSKQLLAMANDKDPFEDTLKKYENDPSVQVSDYEDAEMRGIEATRTIKDISDDKWNQKADTENVKAARNILDSLAPITPGSDYPLKQRKDLHELSDIEAMSVYVECEHHDTVEGANFIINNTDKIAEAIAKGICSYYGIEW